MKIERLESVGINVKNLDEAIELFSDILGITFVKLGTPNLKKNLTEHSDRGFEQSKMKVAMDRTGFLELIESDPPVEKEGLRNIHFKVSNLEEAKAEMKQKGIRIIADVAGETTKEAIFSPDDLHGVRLCLLEYDADNPVDAVLSSM